MARPGITYPEVEAAIHAIIAQGENPTINRVRDKLGTGSPNTILMHLNAWRAAAPVIARKAPELPADLQAALVAEMERQAAQARAEPEKQLLQARDEAAELAKAGEALEAERDALAEQVNLAMSERDQANTVASERAHELEILRSDRERERAAAEGARVELAKQQLKAESAETAVNDLKADIKKIHVTLDETREALAASKAAAASRIAVAEQAAAVAVAKSESAQDRIADLLTRVAAAEAERALAQAQASELKGQLAQMQANTKATRKPVSKKMI